MKLNQPVFFRKKPLTTETKTDAVFKRNVGQIKGENIVEIFYCGELWKVKETEVRDPQTALTDYANELKEKINKAKETNNTQEKIALAVGMSVQTLKQRMKLVQQHATK